MPNNVFVKPFTLKFLRVCGLFIAVGVVAHFVAISHFMWAWGCIGVNTKWNAKGCHKIWGDYTYRDILCG